MKWQVLKVKHRVVLVRSNPVNPNPAVERIASVLTNENWDVTVVGWDRSKEYDACEGVLTLGDKTARIIRFGIPAVFSGGIKKNLVPLIKFEKKLAKWFREHKDEYDAIHAFDFDTGFVAKHAAKKYKKGLVYQIQDFYAADRFDEGSLGYNIIKSMEFSVINNADASIICTEARKKQIAGSHPKMLEVVHNTPGYSKVAENDEFNVSYDKVKIAYVGCFEPGRFLKELITIAMNDSRIELHIGGFGLYEEYVKECCKKSDRIIFYGKLPYDKVLSLEKKCDIISALYDPAVSNNRYAAPNKLYESMMLSKPVIMCENTGWDEVIVSNDIGVIAKPSENGIKQALHELIEKKNLWTDMGKRSNELYQSTYSWSIMSERVKKLYCKLYGREEK